MRRFALVAAMAGLAACQSTPERFVETRTPVISTPALLPALPAAPGAPPLSSELKSPEAAQVAVEPVPELAAAPRIVTVQAEEPRYLPPESLKKFRYAKPPAEKAAAPPSRPTARVAEPTQGSMSPGGPATAAAATAPAQRPEAAELPSTNVATVTAMPDEPRYKLPESLAHWNSGRKVPLYADPDAAPWQATPTEPRLQNAAVSCNYKDEGGVRGKAMLLVDNHRLTRFTARIEMPNGGTCQFDSKKMEQLPFEQGIALQSKGDECIVRMWEQKHRITIAAYSCHKQCSRGSFSYLWPIIMDTRVGTCY